MSGSLVAVRLQFPFFFFLSGVRLEWGNYLKVSSFPSCCFSGSLARKSRLFWGISSTPVDILWSPQYRLCAAKIKLRKFPAVSFFGSQGPSPDCGLLSLHLSGSSSVCLVYVMSRNFSCISRRNRKKRICSCSVLFF